MKYIFLDIDGVLNGANNVWKFVDDPALESNYRFLDRGNWVEVEILKRLQNLVNETGAVIIGISSWFISGRKGSKGYIKEFGLEAIEEVLELPIFDISDCVGGSEERGRGLLNWLSRNNYDESKDSFVVLDDGGERYYNFPTVISNGRTGLTDNDIILAKYFLNNPLSLDECLSLQKDYKYKEVQ